jgi:hypothetical protein
MKSVIVYSKLDFENIHDNSYGHSSFCFAPTSKISFPKIFNNINGEDIINTFNYIYDKIQKGIFVKLGKKGSQIISFISREMNEWGHLVTFDLKLLKNENFKIFQDPKYWHTNNGLMRFENPHIDHHHNLNSITEMFTELVEKRNIPEGIEFFVNKRDFPIVTKDAKYEPYFNIYGTKHEIIGDKLCSMAPILSFSKKREFDDILIPTYQDWEFSKQKPNPVKWKFKKNKAVFRGSNTGPLFDNVRKKLCTSAIFCNHELLDVGITKNKKRLIKCGEEMKFNEFPCKTVKPLSLREQAFYKFIIHIEGHTSAFRLGRELSTRSCLLLVESEWISWIKLEPFVHYIPIKRDLSNLLDTIAWGLENDDVVRKIGEKAYNFYLENLTRDKILDYLENVLQNLSIHTGSYRYHPIKWNTFIEQHLPQFTNFNDWFLARKPFDNFINLSNLTLEEKVLCLFQSLVKFQYLQWHFSIFLIDFEICIEKISPRTIVLHELYDHFFYECEFNVKIVSNDKIFYVKNNFTNYWNIKHNFYDVLEKFHMIKNLFKIEENLCFQEAFKIFFQNYNEMYQKHVKYEKRFPTPLLPALQNIEKYSDSMYCDKLIIYRKILLLEKYVDQKTLTYFKNCIKNLTPQPIQFTIYDRVGCLHIDLEKSINPKSLQYNPKDDLSLPDCELEDDSRYIRLLFETIKNNKFITQNDTNIYSNMFEPLFRLNKIEYTIKLARLNTVLKYIIKGTSK